MKKWLHRYFIDGLSGMALGLFSTLIVGLILKQIGALTHIQAFVWMGTIASICTGVGIGIGVASKLKAPPLVIYASAVTGTIGAYAAKIIAGAAFDGASVVLTGPGDPLGAYIAALVGIELGTWIFGKTKLDIVVVPLVTIISGALIGLAIGKPLAEGMAQLCNFITLMTQQAPFVMSVLISTIMGMALTLPISSAAISIILNLSGMAAGAATVGCSTQMVGFAVASYRENKVNGLLAQGMGTSMLQVPNIVRNPMIWIPPTIASAILGPIGTLVLGMENNAAGGGMGTSGFVGQLMTWQVMSATNPPIILLGKILLIHFILPAVLTLAISEWMRKKNWIKPGDMKLDL